MRRFVGRLLAGLTLAAATVVGVTVVAAPADAGTCHIFQVAASEVVTINNVTYTQSPTFTVSGTSVCNHIRVRHFEPTPCSPSGSLYLRVRFLPQNTVTNFIETPCGSDTRVIVAENVPNYQQYRFEISADSGHPFTLEAMD